MYQVEETVVQEQVKTREFNFVEPTATAMTYSSPATATAMTYSSPATVVPSPTFISGATQYVSGGYTGGTVIGGATRVVGGGAPITYGAGATYGAPMTYSAGATYGAPMTLAAPNPYY